MYVVSAMSEAFTKYMALLVLLHHEMESGRDGGLDDTPADLIRDQMDAPWYAMTASEQDAASRVSEMVYSLCDR